jgi:hypothetical protein
MHCHRNLRSHEMTRVRIAFVIAPLVVPLSLLPWLLTGNVAPNWILTTMIIGAVVGYVGTFVFGTPVYLLLKVRGYTALWIAIAAGFAIGDLMWLFFSVIFALSLDEGAAGVRFALSDPPTLGGVFWPGGVLGAAVGLVFWLIARPNSQAQLPD